MTNISSLIIQALVLFVVGFSAYSIKKDFKDHDDKINDLANRFDSLMTVRDSLMEVVINLREHDTLYIRLHENAKAVAFDTSALDFNEIALVPE